MNVRPSPWKMPAVAVTALLALAACAGGPAASSTPGSVATTGPAATVAPAATAGPAATAAPTVAPPKTLPSVDIVLSGGIGVTAKGAKGQCTLGRDASGTVVRFGFSALEADYPGLGQGLFISEGSNGFVDIKWLVNASTAYINVSDVKGVSADHHSITIDVDLGGPAKEHLKATITCP